MKQPRPQRKSKLDRATAFRVMASCMNTQIRDEKWKPFPVKFYVIEPSPGVREVIYEKGEGLVAFCHQDMVKSTILQYCQGPLRSELVFPEWTSKMARECSEFWMDITDPIPMPKLVAFEEDPALAFYRLPFNPRFDRSKHPHFDELMSRTGNANALMAFIGSLFQPDADRQQYVWMYGEGMNGKGSLIRFLRQLLGPAYGAEDAGQTKSQFWTSGLIGKRLIVFGDCNSYSFPASQKFKGVSGGDPVRVERKNQASYTVELDCKFLFASNEKPALSSQKSDLRRAIYCEMSPIKAEPDPKYDEKLWAEAPYILGTCQGIYWSVCSDHSPIPADTVTLNSIVEENEGQFEAIFADFFLNDPRVLDEQVSAKTPVNQLFLLDPNDFNKLLGKIGVDKSERRRFIKYLSSKYRVVYKPVKVEGKLLKRYTGVKLSTRGEDLISGRYRFGY